MEIKTETIMDAWRSGLKHIMDSGQDFKDENNRVCREILNLIIEIKSPCNDISSAISFLNSFNKWIYPSTEEIADLIISRKMSPTYSYSHGPRLFNFCGTVNQIDSFIIPLLRKNPFSRRGIAVIWSPADDSHIYKREVPGLVSIYFKISGKKLNATMSVRSNDLFFGWPANIYQLFILSDYVSKKLNCEIGSLTTFSNSAHLFKDQFQDILLVLKD